MMAETKGPRDHRTWRVVPQPDRGGEQFGLHLPATDEGLAALLSGKGPHEVQMIEVRAGQTTNMVPAASVAWLVARGWIEEAPTPTRKAPAARVAVEAVAE